MLKMVNMCRNYYRMLWTMGEDFIFTLQKKKRYV